MREIRFNAWDKVNKTMHCFINHPDNWSFSYLNQDVFIWLQYTGLKDKNGKEIYEGDIVHSDGGITCQISWVDDKAAMTLGFYCITPQGFAAALTPSTGAIVEIIGNIFENPELVAK